ncbi:sigma factor [Micromonospora sp. NPDC047548]|uniref:sigma factor n=1 Tax=Micromonospora sp. NPDC047548 TaxID=3155624 RepID=UPI0033CD787A
MEVGVDPEESFRAYVSGRISALSRAAWLLTGDRHQAEDLVQLTLVRVARHWERVSASGDPDPYVRRTMYSQHVSLWRRCWRNVVVPPALVLAVAVAPSLAAHPARRPGWLRVPGRSALAAPTMAVEAGRRGGTAVRTGRRGGTGVRTGHRPTDRNPACGRGREAVAPTVSRPGRRRADPSAGRRARCRPRRARSGA